ncbi:MAG: PD40 domain-containing protein [Actinobacteria bacterium]|nr:PD40 domain-containing protein [Actinomycetota bacterium]
MVVVVVMVAACAVLVGISYLMLDILSGMVVAPKTPVREVESAGELVLPTAGGEVLDLEVCGDGRLLAVLESPTGSATSLLRVFDLSRVGEAVLERETGARGVAWVGDSRRLVYEDGGDIRLLDAETGEEVRLTSGPEVDYDPLPSPDGRFILWTRSKGEGRPGSAAQMWVMDSESGEAEMLAPRAELAAWDPAGGRVASRGRGYLAEGSGGSEYYLQVATRGRQGWEYLASCKEEPLFLWWPRLDKTLYVAAWRPSDQAATRAVWFEVGDTGEEKKAASSESLGDDAARYRFYPSRRMARVAYIGDKGLEYLDYDAGRIYRFTRVSAACPLAWDEAGNGILYCGEGGICRVALPGG